MRNLRSRADDSGSLFLISDAFDIRCLCVAAAHMLFRFRGSRRTDMARRVFGYYIRNLVVVVSVRQLSAESLCLADTESRYLFTQKHGPGGSRHEIPQSRYPGSYEYHLSGVWQCCDTSKMILPHITKYHLGDIYIPTWISSWWYLMRIGSTIRAVSRLYAAIPSW